MSERLLKVKDKDGNIEYVEGLISIVYSKKQDLYIFEGDCFINKKNKDYIEIFYSVRNAHAVLMSSPTLNSPSRPATPSAYLLIEKIN